MSRLQYVQIAEPNVVIYPVWFCDVPMLERALYELCLVNRFL